MKCPKCGYLGFESGDKCRNCGYDFSLVPASSAPLDFPLDAAHDQPRPPLDLDRIIGGPAASPSAAADLPLFSRDDAPLITAPARPRAPLGVRRPTPEVPRARTRTPRQTGHPESLFQAPPAAVIGPAVDPRHAAAAAGAEPPASAASRVTAALLDLALLSAVDAGVVYFTLRLLGMASGELFELPLLPLAAFFLLLNGGYFVAFTAVGGQSIGKMALGIKVIGPDNGTVAVGRATVRTLAYLVSALPLGAGFLPGVMGADGLALHDRLAQTRVVRPSSS